MRKVAVLSAGLLTLALLAGCGSDKQDAADGLSKSDGRAATAPAAPLREQGPMSPNRQDDSTEVTAERKEVVTGSVDITTDDPIGGATEVADRVRAANGRVDARSEQPGTDTTEPHATLTVRLPADKTDEFIEGLGGVGEVTSVSTQREDVTMQWQDLDARIKALQASVDRLRALVAGAATTADLIAAENALSSRQGELDSLTARKRQLDDEVALSTLTIELDTDEPPGSRPDNYWTRIVDGWHALLDALKSTGSAIPWLGFLAILAALAWAIRRIVRARRRPAQAPAPEPPKPENPSTPTESAPAETHAANSSADNGTESASSDERDESEKRGGAE
ncbi:DUF4349 domain-containing protein [Nocardia wallacei]|uniref:DUF4349 domain-containing protein n=1 Tax=Nocardia wallacei TaxID=480035 RepID=UPI0024550298|nr:DUF4349 domain-containing protein [Nocardia wallacei]